MEKDLLNMAFLRAIRLSAGKGENHFTMTRGSFRYKSRLLKKEALTLVRSEVEEHEVKLY